LNAAALGLIFESFWAFLLFLTGSRQQPAECSVSQLAVWRPLDKFNLGRLFLA
jgi:hypothetical protein